MKNILLPSDPASGALILGFWEKDFFENKEYNYGKNLNLRKLFLMYLRNLWIIILVGIIFAGVAFVAKGRFG